MSKPSPEEVDVALNFVKAIATAPADSGLLHLSETEAALKAALRTITNYLG